MKVSKIDGTPFDASKFVAESSEENMSSRPPINAMLGQYGGYWRQAATTAAAAVGILALLLAMIAIWGSTRDSAFSDGTVLGALIQSNTASIESNKATLIELRSLRDQNQVRIEELQENQAILIDILTEVKGQ